MLSSQLSGYVTGYVTLMIARSDLQNIFQLLSFQNLVAKAPSQNLPSMLVAQLLPFVKNLGTRKWSDEDIIEDVQYLKDELNARFESLTYVPISPHTSFSSI